MREAASRRPTSSPWRDRVQGAGRGARRSPRSSGRSASRWSSSRPAAARRSGVKFARSGEELPGALVGAFSYDRKVLLERYVEGRDLAVSVLDGDRGARPERRAVALPVVEAVPREEDFYDFESRYEIGMTTFVCPAELPARDDRAGAGAGARGLRAARLPRLRARRPDARAATAASCGCSRPTSSPA